MRAKKWAAWMRGRTPGSHTEFKAEKGGQADPAWFRGPGGDASVRLSSKPGQGMMVIGFDIDLPGLTGRRNPGATRSHATTA